MLHIAYHPCYAHQLPEGHRFPMAKYELLAEQLLYEGTLSPSNFVEPKPLPKEDILAIHSPEYWQALDEQSLDPRMVRRIGFPLSPELIQRSRIIAQGTIDCALAALQQGVALNIAGGTHHSYRDRGEGFCLLNDIALASSYLLRHKLVKQILIVDLDVHQGNGTAHIFAQEPRVFCFSMHGANNYPLHKEQSDLDLALPDKTEDRHYLKLLSETLPRLIDQVQPDFMFFLSGVDVLESDRLGRLSLSIQGCRERDRIVFSHARAAGIPLALSMGGGYSPRLADIVNAHANSFRLAQELYF